MREFFNIDRAYLPLFITLFSGVVVTLLITSVSSGNEIFIQTNDVVQHEIVAAKNPASSTLLLVGFALLGTYHASKKQNIEK